MFRTQILFVDAHVNVVAAFSFEADGESWASCSCFFSLCYLSLEGAYSKHQILPDVDRLFKRPAIIAQAEQGGLTREHALSLLRLSFRVQVFSLYFTVTGQCPFPVNTWP